MSIPSIPDDQQPQQPRYAPPPPAAPQYPPQYSQPQYGPPQYAAPGAPQYPGQQAYPVPPGYPQPTAPWIPGPVEPFDGAATPDDLTRPLYGATFGQAVRRYFKNYANFSGRASRSEYWWVVLFTFLIFIVPATLLTIGLFGVIDAAIRNTPEAPAGALTTLVVGGILYGIIGLGTLVPSYAIGWRRLQDVNIPGPLYLLSLASWIPIVNYVSWIGLIVLFIFTLLSPKSEGRRFDRR